MTAPLAHALLAHLQGWNVQSSTHNASGPARAGRARGRDARTPMAISLVLADDHPIVLDGLENLFRLEQDFEVVARCPDGEEALRAVRRHKPDVLVLDLRLPGMDGVAVLREIQKEQLPTRVVLLTAALDEDDVLDAIRLGVRGVVLK